MRQRKWSASERKLLREMYADTPTKDVAHQLGRDVSSVYRQAAALGLKKSDAYLQSVSSGRMQRGKLDPRMMSGRFSAGFTPWNKGIKWDAGGRSVESRFKPGQKPSKTMPIGSYRIVKEKSGNQHLEVKTSDTPGANHMRWTPVSRVVWEAAFGEVPENHLVVFRKGMHTCVLEEITPDRVECITRAEHARRNHPMNISPEYARLVQLKGAITRQVKRISTESQEREANEQCKH